jgi:hypothetical protein
LVEHSLGKGEVTSSILVISSSIAVNSEQWDSERMSRKLRWLAPPAVTDHFPLATDSCFGRE